jgi:IS605 OrfB family transposase
MKSWFRSGKLWVGSGGVVLIAASCAYIRRRYAARRRKLGLHAIRKSRDKEARWMKRHHKISHQIVNFAVSNGIGLIRMEDLTDIRNRAKSRKEAGWNLHSWAFYQLKEMIR